MMMTLEGDFDSMETVPGQLADFNMWKKEMTFDELNLELCGMEGDVVSWNTLQEEGSAIWTKKEYTDCNGKKTLKLFMNLTVLMF